MKTVIALLCILSPVLACDESSLLKSLAAGILSGYHGPDATIPIACFNHDIFVSLEDSLIKTFTHLVKGSEDYAASQQELVSAGLKALESCGFDVCPERLALWNSTNTQLAIGLNMIFSLGTTLSIFKNGYDALVNQEWEELGYNVGKYARLVSEGDSYISFLTDSRAQSFLKGTILGLSRKPIDSHPCYEKLLGVSDHAVPLLEGGFYYFVQGNDTKLVAAQEALGALYDDLYAACKVQKFMDTVVTKLMTSGYTAFASNLMMGMKDLNEAYAGMKTDCFSPDYELCGRNVGKAARAILGWSL